MSPSRINTHYLNVNAFVTLIYTLEAVSHYRDTQLLKETEKLM